MSDNFRQFWGTTGSGGVEIGHEDGAFVVRVNGTERGRISASDATGVFAGGGGGSGNLNLNPTSVKTTAYTASAGDFVPVDTTSGSVTITLPAAPANLSTIAVKQVVQGYTANVPNTVTVARGGSDVFNRAGGATSLTLSLLNQAVFLQYKASSAIWYVVSDDLPLSQLDSRYRKGFNVRSYGATGDGTTDDRGPIQAAIDAAGAAFVALGYGQTVYFPPGTYIIGASGSLIGGRAYSLALPSGVTLLGDGPTTVTIKADNTSTDFELITTTPRYSGTLTNIGIQGLSLDGNSEVKAQTVGGVNTAAMNLWLYGVTDLFIENVCSNNGSNWNSRIEACSRVRVNGWGTYSSTDFVNSDGLHFIDTSKVVCNNVNVYTSSDDAFIIQMQNGDVSDYSVSGLYTEAPRSDSNHWNRGCALVQGITSTTMYTMSNINIQGTFKNTHSWAVNLYGGQFYNVHIDAVSDGCFYDLYLEPGASANAPYHGAFTGYINNCSFNIVGSNAQRGGILTVPTNGTFRNNRITANIYNPGDTYRGVELYGDHWVGDITVDMNPLGTHSSVSDAVVVRGSYNMLRLACRGGDNNLIVAQTGGPASHNTFFLGPFLDPGTRDILVQATCVNNTFIGGEITNYVNSGGATNFFLGVRGAEISGSTDVLAGLVSQGLRAASSNPPLNLGTGTVTCGTLNAGAISGTSGSLTGALNMNSHKITSVTAPGASGNTAARGDALTWPIGLMPGVLDVQVFGADPGGAAQTWVNPLVGTVLVVYMKGGGGGGGGGVNSASAGNPRSGGGGGGGGGWLGFAVPISAIGGNATVRVAAGGAGGTAGAAGGDASRTTQFDSTGGNANITAATGGGAGGSGASTGGSGGVGTAPTYAGYTVSSIITNGGAGGAGTTSAAAGGNGTTNSGGAGGGVSTTPTGQNGGAGITANHTTGVNGAAGVGGAAAALTQGAPGISSVLTLAGLQQMIGGGGGGGCHTNGTGGARGANGYAGGGGGGGGSAVNGAAGLGGNGGDGMVIAIVFA